MTPRVLPLYRRLGWPLHIVGERRVHWGEECYLCTLGLPHVARVLLEKAEHSAYFAWRFVQVVAHRATAPSHWIFWCHIETILFAAVTLLTPWIDAAERIENGQALSTYGSLFPLYIVHISGYWLMALFVALNGEVDLFQLLMSLHVT